MGISDYLVKIDELTNTNLKLLKSLNDAFYTDKTHLNVNVGDGGSYVIPSFISLENKINALQDNFENLVKSPVTSEAYFVFDGNSRAIEVKGYEQSPSPLILDDQSKFHHENNDILKDFLTPVPFLKFNISDLPNDITSVVVRKVSAISEDAVEKFKTFLNDSPSSQVNWGDIKKVLDYLQEDVDYVSYDTIQRLPLREGQGYGTYIVREIVEESIDENLDQHLTVRFANDIDGYQKGLTYLLFDQTIEHDLEIGDYIVSWDGHAKYVIEELDFNSNTVKMRVMYGEYADLFPYTDPTNEQPIVDISKMRFFSEANLFTNDKFVKVPLEEDRYIFVAIAPINNRMNIRASWGSGIVVDTDVLMSNDEEGVSFKEYYKSCRNIGDILNEISKVMSNTTTSHSQSELDDYMTAKPVIDTDILKVTHINKHLDDSPTVQNIRALYAQKNNYNADLTETQSSLNALQDQLATVDFQDTTGVRASLQNQIDELTDRKNNLINSLIKVSDEIALAANNSIVPLENAKYRIRGFFDFVEFANQLNDEYHNITEGNIKGIYVQYRYRNVQQEIGTAETFTKDKNGDGKIDENETFIFSDWNELPVRLRPRVRNSDGTYGPYMDTSNMNLPSFNQIDIPITQGENVDVRLKVIYDFGYPFIQMVSGWSDIVTFNFPEEFMKNVQILDIISENNDDIETNRFNNILINNGITAHVDDKLVDQDVTYFHKPENISSGFYTPERRVIPLSDKLKTINDDIITLKDEVLGSAEEQISVSVDFDGSSIDVSPFEIGNVMLKEYEYFISSIPTSEDSKVTTTTMGNYVVDSNQVVSITCNIQIVNKSNHSLRIFSIFPGTDQINVNNLKNSKFNKWDYCVEDTTGENSKGVWINQPQVLSTDDDDMRIYNVQKSNQFIYFRINNPYDGKQYYNTGIQYFKNNILSYDKDYTHLTKPDPTPAEDMPYGMAVYPYLIKTNGLNMTYKEAYSYMLLNPGDKIIVPVMVEYRLSPGNSATYNMRKEIQKTISFDIRTSLYSEPTNYTINIGAKYTSTASDKIVSSLTKNYQPQVLHSKEYNVTVR